MKIILSLKINEKEKEIFFYTRSEFEKFVSKIAPKYASEVASKLLDTHYRSALKHATLTYEITAYNELKITNYDEIVSEYLHEQ